MKEVGRNAVVLGSVEFHTSQSAREEAHLTCPPEHSGAQVSAQKTGANLGHRAYYNFCRIHQTLRVTPAMEAGLTDHVWTIAELLNSPA